MELKQFTEHDRVGTEELDRAFAELLQTQIRSSVPTQDLRFLRMMGMDFDWRASKFVLSYYVGVDWIDKKKGVAMMVRPKVERVRAESQVRLSSLPSEEELPERKIEGIDFQTMFMKCFENREVSKDLDKLFFIRTEDDPIEIPADAFQLEPLILVFFMNLVGRIVRKGLKHDYILREERLNAQIKGKLLMSRYVKHGLAQQRPDQTECRYQEYHVDCLENRIIKAALLLCRAMITRHETALGHHLLPLQQMYRNAISAFAEVSPDVTLQDLHRVHINPVFKDYKEAMPLAKMIIRHQGHLVREEGKGKRGEIKVPPFIINMPILFERYVYCLLAERYGTRLIGYQEGCGDSVMDFTKKDEHMILDTKYIPSWNDHTDHDNARQLSGYARRTALRDKYLFSPSPIYPEFAEGEGQGDGGQLSPTPEGLGEVPCVVIYPSNDGLTTLSDLPDRWLIDDGTPTFSALQQVKEYQKFYKLPVRLPVVPS